MLIVYHLFCLVAWGKEAIRGTCPQLSGMHQGYAGSETAPNFHPPSRTSMGEACFRSLRDKWQHISARRGLLFTVHGSTDAFNNNVSCSYSSIEGHILTSRHLGNIDYGLQYSSQEFQLFTKEYNFQHIISSPYYPQSNGLAERMVKTAKTLLSNPLTPIWHSLHTGVHRCPGVGTAQQNS